MSRKPYAVILLPTSLFFFAAELYVSFSAYRGVTESFTPVEIGKQLALFSLQADFYMPEFENSCTPGEPPKPGTGLLNVKAAAEK